jgi:tetratricopeptide (TPR) repeat protein
MPIAANSERATAALGVFLPRDQDARALRSAQEALTLAQATGEPFHIAFAEMQLGRTLLHRDGDLAAAQVHLVEALRRCRALGADMTTSVALGELGRLHAAQGQRDEARRQLQEALALAEAIGDRAGTAVRAALLATLASEAGDHAQAITACRMALQQSRDLGNLDLTGISLTGIALLLAASGQPEQAARLLGAAASHLAGRTPALMGRWPAQHETAVVALKAMLSTAAFAQAWAEGEALSLEQATDLA